MAKGSTQPTSKIRVGVLGLGVVGQGVAEILARNRDLIRERTGLDFEIIRALVNNPKSKRSGAARKIAVVTDAAKILEADDIDIVVEMIGGIEPARSYVLRALTAGKPVVTANKAILAAHGPEILQAAQKAKSDIYFEATVAGGVPIIRTLREALASDAIMAVRGILNGTTNFILGRMETGEPFAEALAQAQKLGFAEADPARDIDGRDAADKLAILTLLAFGRSVKPEQIETVGIENLTPECLQDARELGYRAKLVGISQRIPSQSGERIDVRVHPVFLPEHHVLSSVPEAQNAIAVDSQALGTTLYQGAGAGGLPTGTAVVADLVDAGRNLKANIHGRIVTTHWQNAPRLLPAKQAVSAYYLRLLVADQPGVVAGLGGIFARLKISLATVLQRERANIVGDKVALILITHPTTHGSMVRAVQAIKKGKFLRGALNVVRIEGEES